MKSIALIHTVKSVASSFEVQLREVLEEEVRIYNIWDEFLASNPNELGVFTTDNRNRLFYDIKSAELTGAQVIVVTCSTLTPAVNLLRSFIKVPLVAIDDAMGKKAVTYGEKILVLATADSTIEPTTAKLREEAAKAGRELQLSSMVCPAAYEAVKKLEIDKHDSLIKEMVKDVSGYDCIVLAQASMAHLEEAVSRICGCPVLSSPQLCMKSVKKLINSIE